MQPRVFPPRRLRRSGVSCLAFGLAALAAQAGVERLDTPRLHLALDPPRARILHWTDPASHRDFAGADPDPAGFWEIELAGAPPTRLCATNAGACRAQLLRESPPGLRMAWTRFALTTAPELAVEVTLRIDPKKPSAIWHLSVDGLARNSITRIRFPRLLDLPRFPGEELAVPAWAGLLARNPRRLLAAQSTTPRRHEYDYPGHGSLQCVAVCANPGPGIALTCDDPAGFRKVFAAFSRPPSATPPANTGAEPADAPRVGPSEADLNLEVIHLPQHSASGATRYTLPYRVAVGLHDGTWFDAATAYRTWATSQTWARQSRWQRDLVPRWIADTGLWLWNRGHSPNVIDPAIALKHESGLPVSVFWHWWHGCAYDTGFPEYLPPREGTASFTNALARAHHHDVHALVYMNQRLWGMTTASWTNENAAAAAVKASDGTIHPEVYNTFSRLPCASMCLGTGFWRAKYAALTVEARNRLGVDGIYMDQACSSLACFDPRHDHPPGGGTYWMGGFRTLTAEIRQRAQAGRQFALAGEGCAENWLPHLDLMLNLGVSRERYATPDGWEPIPFFHAVYHDHTILYGSYSSLTMPPYDELWPPQSAPAEPLRLLDRKFRHQFHLEQARAFVWGQQPTLANFQTSHLHDRPAEIAHVLALARLRWLARKYLQNGAMLPPPDVNAPRQEIPISRLSIYAGQGGAPQEFAQTVPFVLASAWRAPDGTVAVAVANIAEHPVRPILTLDIRHHGLAWPGRFHTLGPAATAPATRAAPNTILLEPVLGPLDARVFEWRAVRP